MLGDGCERHVGVASADCRRSMTYYIETFGCQMNERDSETISALLSREGMEEVADPALADIIVVNTCAVRETAESKVWSRLGKLSHIRKGGQAPAIVLAGCMAQIPENVERIRRRFPAVKVVAGPGNIHKIPDLLGQVRLTGSAANLASGGRGTAIAVSPPRTGAPGTSRDESTQVLPEGLPRKPVPGVTAYVTIMYGCDNFCSYCVVPFVRGPQVSRPVQAILDEVKGLADKGCKEVTLLGQNVNAYGQDLGDMQGFSRLLRELDRIDGIKRIRFMTSHPRDFTRDMVDAVAECPKVCEHFHLPLQAGSNRILKLMNRGYTREDYMALVEYIRTVVPHAGITTDIIVGFPSETEDDFQDTLDMVRRVRFDGAFTFVFSPRKRTAAARMKEQVPEEEKSRRMQELVAVQSEITKEKNRDLIGSEVEILVESPDDEIPCAVRGRTRTGRMVIALPDTETPQIGSPASRTLVACVGDLVRVRVEEAGTWYLKGPVAG